MTTPDTTFKSKSQLKIGTGKRRRINITCRKLTAGLLSRRQSSTPQKIIYYISHSTPYSASYQFFLEHQDQSAFRVSVSSVCLASKLPELPNCQRHVALHIKSIHGNLNNANVSLLGNFHYNFNHLSSHRWCHIIPCSDNFNKQEILGT